MVVVVAVAVIVALLEVMSTLPAAFFKRISPGPIR
jgi:hypothetical protein